MCCRQNALEARKARAVLLHWQHAQLAKVWARWVQYKGRRQQLFGHILAIAVRWEKPLLQDAWESWRAYVEDSRAIKVCGLPWQLTDRMPPGRQMVFVAYLTMRSRQRSVYFVTDTEGSTAPMGHLCHRHPCLVQCCNGECLCAWHGVASSWQLWHNCWTCHPLLAMAYQGAQDAAVAPALCRRELTT